MKFIHHQDGGYIETWEIDFQNIIYQPLTSAYSFNLSTITSYKNISVSEYGDRIILISNWNILNSKIIKVDIDNFVIDEIKTFSFPYTNNSGIYLNPLSTDRVIIYDIYKPTGSGGNFWATHITLLDSNQNFMREVTSSTRYQYTDNFQYAVSSRGNIYSVNVDLTNYSVTYTQLQKNTVDLWDYMNGAVGYVMIGNKYILTSKDGTNYIFLFEPLEETALSLVQTQNYGFTVSEYTGFKLFINLVFFGLCGNHILRMMEMKRDYEKLVALRYHGEYFYRQDGGVLTAGQPDVRAGKSFIGWMGYPEIGTMEVEE